MLSYLVPLLIIAGFVRLFSIGGRKKRSRQSGFRIDWSRSPATIMDEIKRSDYSDQHGFKAKAERASYPLGTYFDGDNRPIGTIHSGPELEAVDRKAESANGHGEH
jgi:hypothetical protein